MTSKWHNGFEFQVQNVIELFEPTFSVNFSNSFKHLLPIETNENRIDRVEISAITYDGRQISITLFHNQQKFLIFFDFTKMSNIYNELKCVFCLEIVNPTH